jgi:hypothetical protein
MMEPDAAPAGGRRNAPPKHSGGAGAPPGGQYEPPARSWLTASTAGSLSQAPDVRRLLTRGRRTAGKARQAYGANTKSAARHRTSVYDCGRSGTKTTANEPGQREKLFGWRAGRRLRIFARRCGYRTDDGSALWRANPSHPEGRKKTAHPAPQRNRAAEPCQIDSPELFESESGDGG